MGLVCSTKKIMDILNPFNDLAKQIFTQQPIIIVLFLVFMLIILALVATRTVSKQNSEDHEEKGLLIELVKDSNQMFAALRDAIDSLSDSLRISQEKRNEALTEQLKEQKETNKNISALNNALATNHSDFVDTITVVLKNQVTGRLDKVEKRVDDIYEIVTTKTDCNDLVLDKISNLSDEIQVLKDTLVRKEE